jgi:DNA-binding NarL/FixJ family response regulator
MPDIGGLETLRRIKILAPHIPVVMVTADIQKKTIDEAMDAGAIDVIPKKIEKAVVHGLLERLFGPGDSA